MEVQSLGWLQNDVRKTLGLTSSGGARSQSLREKPTDHVRDDGEAAHSGLCCAMKPSRNTEAGGGRSGRDREERWVCVRKLTAGDFITPVSWEKHTRDGSKPS